MSNGREYDRQETYTKGTFSFLGTGNLGGKAKGLVSIQESITAAFPENRFGSYIVDIPEMTVLRTDIFRNFIDANDLSGLVNEGCTDGTIADRFLHSAFPAMIAGDLMSLVGSSKTPLAVRSSSLLEDSLQRPFAGLYITKMIPNNPFSPTERYRKLQEAIKLVYASTFFQDPRSFGNSTGTDMAREEMAVIIQRVVGMRHGNRFYPVLSGVARSFNAYPYGNAGSEDGIASLAVGLGKTIVDGEKSWSYCPRYPASPPPFRSSRDMLNSTQTRFWGVNLENPTVYRPAAETEFLADYPISCAESDGLLHDLCSTYDPASDRFEPGAIARGARLVDFYSLRRGGGEFNDLICKVLETAEERTGTPVEIEFAVDRLPSPERDSHFEILQVRPLSVPSPGEGIDRDIIDSVKPLIRTSRAAGNGTLTTIRDLIHVKPERFKPGDTREIGNELGELNKQFLLRRERYILLGFGRWGSSDPWLGIPVHWSQISSAGAVVEAEFPGLCSDFSQGTHFFHNVSNLGILYLSSSGTDSIDWDRLKDLESPAETLHLRQVHSDKPFLVWADCRSGNGGIIL